MSAVTDAGSMENFLTELSQLREADPEAFAKAMEAMKSMGHIPRTSDQSTEEFEATNDGQTLHQLTDAIERMRGENSTFGDSEKDLKLPKESNKKGIDVVPEPGFVLKTFRNSDGTKIFVNMTQHEAVDAPAIKKKLDDNGQEVEGMNIPMSVGPPRGTVDKKGTECIVYDIIVNPIVIAESSTDKSGRYREFICQLGIQYLEQKYKEKLSNKYKLPKLKYMGSNVAKQFIQDRKNMPKIEEVSNTSNTTAAKQASAGSVGKAGKTGKAATKVGNDPAFEKALSVDAVWLESDVPPSVHSNVLQTFLHPLDVDTCTHTHFSYSLFEYIDPIQALPPRATAIMLTADVPAAGIASSQLGRADGMLQPENQCQVLLSPYKVSIKIPGFKQRTCNLPTAVLPAHSRFSFRRPYDGCLSTLRLQIVLPIDHGAYEERADAGSKPWLMSQALSDGKDYQRHRPRAGPDGGPDQQSELVTSNLASAVALCPHAAATAIEHLKSLLLEPSGPYLSGIFAALPQQHHDYSSTLQGAPANSSREAATSGNPEFAEDKFHLNLPDDVDQYTGMKLGDDDDELPYDLDGRGGRVDVDAITAAGGDVDADDFPEDRFHRNDASSQFLINQREQAKKDKWAKHEQEKKEREHDPNVEYIDMEEFRPGGKYANSVSGAQNTSAEGNACDKSNKNAALKPELRKAENVVAAATSSSATSSMLSSNMWSELLD